MMVPGLRPTRPPVNAPLPPATVAADDEPLMDRHWRREAARHAVITGLTTSGAQNDIGLFGSNLGAISNLNLANVSVTADPNVAGQFPVVTVTVPDSTWTW